MRDEVPELVRQANCNCGEESPVVVCRTGGPTVLLCRHSGPGRAGVIQYNSPLCTDPWQVSWVKMEDLSIISHHRTLFSTDRRLSVSSCNFIFSLKNCVFVKSLDEFFRKSRCSLERFLRCRRPSVWLSVTQTT